MTTYTYTEARQRLAALLDQARREGAAGIRRRDGSEFLLRFEPEERSPLDVAGIKTDMTTEEIVEIIREGRERPGGSGRTASIRRNRVDQAPS